MWHVVLESWQWIHPATHNCFCRHRSAPDSLANWHGALEIYLYVCTVYVCMYAMWYVALGWHAVEFARLQRLAMSYVALGSWHWFARWQHPAMWQVALVWLPLNSPKRPPYWNYTSGFNFDHITAVDVSAPAICEILSKSDHPRQKNDVMSIFKMAELSHLGF